MPNEPTTPNPNLATQKEFAEIRAAYKDNITTDTMNALIIGHTGSGKTSLALSSPKPVLVYSFDPGGTDSVKEEIEKGEIIVRKYETDSLFAPVAYKEFEADFNADRKSGIFKHIGVTFLDGLSNFIPAMIWQIMAKEGRIPPGMSAKLVQEGSSGKGMRIQDWGQLSDFIMTICRAFIALPCHTIITGHVSLDKDEVIGGYIKSILAPGKSKNTLPILMPEVWILQKMDTSTGTERKLLTRNVDSWRATTRMGRKDRFDTYEKADVRYLLKKAGFPYEDKPLFLGES